MRNKIISKQKANEEKAVDKAVRCQRIAMNSSKKELRRIPTKTKP
jgi:hypothetical protein